MFGLDTDAQIRLKAFEWLRAHFGQDGVLSRDELLGGFEHDGRRIPLIDRQKGIFRPGILAGLPLSILTAPLKPGKPRPYDDDIGEDGLVRYKYRGTDPFHPDNRALREAASRGKELIYFLGITPGRYAPAWPVKIVGEDQARLTFFVATGDAARLPQNAAPPGEVEDVFAPREYATFVAFRRLHQRSFRERVLAAYQVHCAVCRLRHRELLDAAHILADRHPKGEPAVSNGLALCRLHHAAFDNDLMGIRPDHVIEIRKEILDEEDGPMLRHGLQGVHRQRIFAPRAAALRPNELFLEERYERFRRAS